MQAYLGILRVMRRMVSCAFVLFAANGGLFASPLLMQLRLIVAAPNESEEGA